MLKCKYRPNRQPLKMYSTANTVITISRYKFYSGRIVVAVFSYTQFVYSEHRDRSIFLFLFFIQRNNPQQRDHLRVYYICIVAFVTRITIFLHF